MTTTLVSLAAALAFGLAGMTSFILTRGVLAADSALAHLRHTRILSAHLLLAGCAMISLAGVYLVTDGLFSMTRMTHLPLSVVAVLFTLLCLVVISLLRNASSRLELPLRWLTPAHTSLIVWTYVLLYYSTIGNVVDVVR